MAIFTPAPVPIVMGTDHSWNLEKFQENKSFYLKGLVKLALFIIDKNDQD